MMWVKLTIGIKLKVKWPNCTTCLVLPAVKDWKLLMQMVCSEFESGAIIWKAQTIARGYGCLSCNRQVFFVF